jgi:hypothetical protein
MKTFKIEFIGLAEDDEGSGMFVAKIGQRDHFQQITIYAEDQTDVARMAITTIDALNALYDYKPK